MGEEKFQQHLKKLNKKFERKIKSNKSKKELRAQQRARKLEQRQRHGAYRIPAGFSQKDALKWIKYLFNCFHDRFMYNLQLEYWNTACQHQYPTQLPYGRFVPCYFRLIWSNPSAQLPYSPSSKTKRYPSRKERKCKRKRRYNKSSFKLSHEIPLSATNDLLELIAWQRLRSSLLYIPQDFLETYATWMTSDGLQPLQHNLPLLCSDSSIITLHLKIAKVTSKQIPERAIFLLPEKVSNVVFIEPQKGHGRATLFGTQETSCFEIAAPSFLAAM